MWNRNIEKEKELIDKEIALYQREKELEVDALVQLRVKTNADIVDKARVDRFEKLTEFNKEIALLQAKKEDLEGYMKEVSLRITEMEKNASQKDAEVTRLNNIISELIKALPSSVTVSQEETGSKSNVKWGK